MNGFPCKRRVSVEVHGDPDTLIVNRRAHSEVNPNKTMGLSLITLLRIVHVISHAEHSKSRRPGQISG